MVALQLWVSLVALAWAAAMGPPPPPSDERSYILPIEAVTLTVSDKFFGESSAVVIKEDEINTYVNGNIDIKQDLSKDCTIQINSENLQGNKWTKLLPTGPLPLCDYMEQQPDKIAMLYDNSDLEPGCPIKMKNVQVNNFTINTAIFPRDLQGESWRVAIVFSCDKEPSMDLNVEVRVVRKE